MLPLSRNAEFSVPPFSVTRASAPTFSVLTTNVPGPAMVGLFNVSLPFLCSRIAPPAMLNAPLLVPPAPINIVPALTLTVPVLLNTVPMEVVVFDCLLKVPLLLKVPPLMVLAKVLASVKLPVLLNALVFATEMVLLAPVLPDQVVLPAFTTRPPVIDLVPEPLMASVPPKFVMPAPVWVPAVQIDGPVTVSAPVPEMVPPPWFRPRIVVSEFSVEMNPLMIATSPTPGGPSGVQLVPTVQSSVDVFPGQVGGRGRYGMQRRGQNAGRPRSRGRMVYGYFLDA